MAGRWPSDIRSQPAFHGRGRGFPHPTEPSSRDAGDPVAAPANGRDGMLLSERDDVLGLVGEDGLDALETAMLGLEQIAPEVASITALTALYTARAWEFLVQNRAGEQRWHLSLEHLTASLRVRPIASPGLPEPTR